MPLEFRVQGIREGYLACQCSGHFRYATIFWKQTSDMHSNTKARDSRTQLSDDSFDGENIRPRIPEGLHESPPFYENKRRARGAPRNNEVRSAIAFVSLPGQARRTKLYGSTIQWSGMFLPRHALVNLRSPSLLPSPRQYQRQVGTSEGQ